MATKQPVLRAVGAALVWGGGFAIFGFGMLFVNFDPSLAGPGTDDPRPFAAVALPISVGALLVGAALWRRGRRGTSPPEETAPRDVWRGSESEVLKSVLLSFNTLVFDKVLIELTKDYRILDVKQNHVGTIRTERHAGFFSLSTARTLAAYDTSGRSVLEMVCPGDSTVHIADGSGRPVGRIVEQIASRKTSLTLEAPEGHPIGSIRQDRWWHDRDLSIRDATGAEVGRISKKWAAHTYILDISGRVSPEMRLLMLASPTGIDILSSQALAAMS